MHALLRSTLAGLGVVLLQWLILGRLTLWGAYPDAVILFVAWIGLRHGRQKGAISGFLAGFLLDFVYDTWGLHMMVKTIVGFAVGLFPSSERETVTIIPRQAFLGGLVIALVHNGLFVTLLALQEGAQNSFLVTSLWLGSALYTAFISVLASLVSER
jgi:rod shape-determining protein MreD